MDQSDAMAHCTRQHKMVSLHILSPGSSHSPITSWQFRTMVKGEGGGRKSSVISEEHWTVLRDASGQPQKTAPMGST